MATVQAQLSTVYPFPDIEDNVPTPPSTPAPSEQPVAVDSCTAVMGFISSNFSNTYTYALLTENRVNTTKIHDFS